VTLILSLFVSGCASSGNAAKRDTGTPEPSLPRIADASSAEFSLAEPKYRTHDLSRLRIGMTRAEVAALFAAPREMKKMPKDEFWEYDWFELYFRDGRLVNWFDL
jgi:hypothetical protein